MHLNSIDFLLVKLPILGFIYRQTLYSTTPTHSYSFSSFIIILSYLFVLGSNSPLRYWTIANNDPWLTDWLNTDKHRWYAFGIFFFYTQTERERELDKNTGFHTTTFSKTTGRVTKHEWMRLSVQVIALSLCPLVQLEKYHPPPLLLLNKSLAGSPSVIPAQSDLFW